MGMIKRASLVFRDTYLKPSRVWMVYLLIISIPFSGYSLVNIGERGLLRPDWFFAFLVIITFYLRLCLSKEKLKMNLIGKGVLLLNFVAILSLFRPLNGSSEQLIDFFTKYLQLLLVSLMYFAVSSLKVREEEINTILKVWILMALFVSLYGIYQVFARNLDLPFAYPRITNPTYGRGLAAGQTFGEYTRPSSFFMEPSFLGSYLIAPLLLTMVILLNHSQKTLLLFKKSINQIIFGCILLALMLSFSLAAYITIGLIGFLMLNKKIKRLSKIFIILTIVALFAFIILPYLGINFPSAFGRIRFEFIKGIRDITEIQGTSMGMRLAKAVATFNLGLAYPFLGVGLNNISHYLSEYEPGWYTWVLPLEENHNMWITTFAEMGILGLFALIFLWYSGIRQLKYSIKKFAGDSKWVIVFTGFYFILWSDIINSNFTHEIMEPQRWFNLAMAGLLINSLKSRNKGH